MSKIKKRNYDKTARSKEEIMTKETQNALIGILLFLVCIIGMINKGGKVGYIIRYIFVYLTGFYNIFFLVGGCLYGIIIFIKRRRPKVKINIIFGAAIALFVFSLIISSANNFTISEVIGRYNRIFNANVEISYLNPELGGGFIGYLIYSLFNQFLGSIGVQIICWVFILASVFLLLKTPLYYGVDYFNKHISKKNVKIKKNNKKEVKRFFDDEEATQHFQKFVEVNEKIPKAQEQEIHEPIIEKRKVEVYQNDNEEFDVFSKHYNFEKKEKPVETIITDSTVFDVFKAPSLRTITAIKEPVYQAPPIMQTPQYKEEIKENEEEFVDSFEEDLFEEEDQEVSEELKNILATEIDLKYQSDYHRKNEQPTNPYIKEEKIIIQKKEVPEIKEFKYQMPNVTLLNDPKPTQGYENQMNAKEKFTLLQNKLDSFGIKASVIDYIISPSFTRFIVSVDDSVKLTAFKAISDDVKLALSAHKVTILAPIPGTNYVGVEIPNITRDTIYIKETLVESINKPLLYVPLGKDISGKVVGTNIMKAPHMLLAGTTGTGKSVCLSNIVSSLIFRTKPTEMKLILIDPKRIEFPLFSTVPHLACPLIVENKHAVTILQRICDFMHERYKLLASVDCKNLEQYNLMLSNQGKPILEYYIVIIDEYAELMSKNKVVEARIQELVQLSRAAGIHLILATQRPTTDVITGTIKNNIPVRVAFTVPSYQDSRTILDAAGAENLLGAGDMLVSIPEEMNLIRAQGTFVKEDEIKRLVEFISKQSAPLYNPYFLDVDKPKQMSMELEAECSDEELEELFMKYLRVVRQTSCNRLTTKFKIGFNRATRILEDMMERGLINKDDTGKWYIEEEIE